MKIFLDGKMFDFSNFPKDSKFFDGTNKKFLEK